MTLTSSLHQPALAKECVVINSYSSCRVGCLRVSVGRSAYWCVDAPAVVFADVLCGYAGVL